VSQIDEQIQTSAATSRPVLEAQRQKYEAALNLAVARRDVLQGLALNSTDGSQTLSQQIDDLRHRVPEAEASDSDVPATQPAVAAAAAAAASSATADQPMRLRSLGLVGLVEEMFTLSRKMSDVTDLADRTDRLRKALEDVRAPLRTQLMDAIRRGDALTGASDSDDPAKLAAQQQELESLTARFTLLTNTIVPMARASAAFQNTATSLRQWHDVIKKQYMRAIQLLVIRLAFMAGAIVLLLVISAIWKRAVFRYVKDVRRRRQFLMVRRLVVGGIIIFILVGGFVTEYGSLATYAGLLTAGIAVALQSVILSGVSHFFFLGRYGVRVGDRVTISGITGDVIDIGIFRMYMLELNGQPNNLQPTGRIVVFSNSVLFQPNAFYKQIPGAEYNWHELGLTLSPDSDYHLAETRLMAAVESVYDEYKENIETQHDQASNALHVQLAKPQMQGRFRFVDSGLEFVVRYPVEMRRAAEIDDKITRKLLETIEHEPRLKLVSTSTPKLQPADGSAPKPPS
ncbi:MAG TPA: mechanosensitive ion channel family protein, partial [Tepidisphaeraceae bacterium]|nr:mechanosensitive ion channel family protein [Tepidisphaeraceae bacterium]